VLQAQEVGLFAQRYHVDHNRGLIQKAEGKGNSGGDKQAQVSRLRVVGGGQLANSAAALPSGGRSPSAGRVGGKARLDKTRERLNPFLLKFQSSNLNPFL
jgi:hypothetical protein